MPIPDFQQNYYELFDLPVEFSLDQARMGARYRQLQAQMHPDRYVNASAHEQRVAVQFSAMINAAYATLRNPLERAIYLMQLLGMSEQDISSQQIDGGFLMLQIELREKLESVPALVDPPSTLDHLMAEITDDIGLFEAKFAVAHAAGKRVDAAVACVKMQYLHKLLLEAEQVESDLMDN